MTDRCAPSPGDEEARRGYLGADYSVDAALPAVDWSLQPFDVMGQATLTFPAPSGLWTDVVVWAQPAGSYGILRFLGQDCNDPTAYQRVTWRVLHNEGLMGGDVSGLIPNLEARCGILDGQMMPFRFFIRPSGFVRVQAQLMSAAVGSEESTVVRARLQGERRDAYGVRA